MRRLTYGVIALVVIAVVIAVGFFIYVIRFSLSAEENYGAFLYAANATAEYIRQNNGQWPRSWNDLRTVRPETDFDWVAEHVTIDLHADPSQIAAQTPETFTAIKPDLPYYGNGLEVQALIDLLAKYHHGAKQNATEQTVERAPE